MTIISKKTLDFAEKLRAHVLGPVNCPSCGQPRSEDMDFERCGQELQCTFNRDYGMHTDAFDNAFAAKHDMLRAADILEELANFFKKLEESGLTKG